MASKTVLIKKYENRRLYDATDSRYVNLDDVARILQRGDEVRVVDVATGEDITRLILTQIVVEGAKARDSSFPLDILRDMVIASGRASQESAIRYTKAMLDLYKSTYRAIPPALNPFEFMQSVGGREATLPTMEAAAEGEPVAATSEVTSLKQRVAELEKMVASLAAKEKRVRGAAARKPGSRRRSTP